MSLGVIGHKPLKVKARSALSPSSAVLRLHSLQSWTVDIVITLSLNT